MNEHLVIRLAGDGHDAEWVVVDDTGACVHAPARGVLGDCTALAPGRRTWLLLPATDVLQASAELPPRLSGKLSQALPFALEDQLADDIDALHFAPGPRADGQVPVRVVHRRCMDGCLSAARAAGLDLHKVVAASDGLPDMPNTAVMLVENAQVVLRMPGHGLVASDARNIGPLLELWLSSPPPASADGALVPHHLRIYIAGDASRHEPAWAPFRERADSLEVHELGESALPRLAAGVVTSSCINLLQGDYARRASWRAHWPRWRVAATFLVTALALQFAVEAAALWRLHRENDHLGRQLARAAAHAFPGVDDMTRIRVLLDDDRRGGPSDAAGAGARGTAFLDSMDSISAALAAVREARLESINYRSGVVELQLRAPSASTLDAIRMVVEEDGLGAEIQSATAVGEEIQGRIRITPEGKG